VRASSSSTGAGDPLNDMPGARQTSVMLDVHVCKGNEITLFDYSFVTLLGKSA
uniref:Uncharacterized protein n=1 Tax=Plectus sambesii TaxID=2011161 RepID=A0A914VSK6_9BILA